MPVFRFKTKWIFEAPVALLWKEINNPASWPEWWRGLYKVSLVKQGNTDGSGAVYHFIWGSPGIYALRFNLEITDVQYNKCIKGKATGDVEGIGSWYFTQENELAHVEYHWHIRTRRKSLSLLAVFLRPLLIFNHRITMIAGKKGLARKLNIKPKSYKKTVRPVLK